MVQQQKTDSSLTDRLTESIIVTGTTSQLGRCHYRPRCIIYGLLQTITAAHRAPAAVPLRYKELASFTKLHPLWQKSGNISRMLLVYDCGNTVADILAHWLSNTGGAGGDDADAAPGSTSSPNGDTPLVPSTHSCTHTHTVAT